MKKPNPNEMPGSEALIGVDSNAGSIMGVASRAMKKAGADRDYIDAVRKIAMSGNYENLLQTYMSVLDGEDPVKTITVEALERDI